MKQIILLLLGAMTLVACNNNSYSRNLKQEKQTIENYMSRMGYHIVDTLPAIDQWGEKDYYRIPSSATDYCFFHLVEPGDTTKKAVKSGETIVLRYREYTLLQPADTADFWTTLNSAYPTEFTYMTDQTGASCQAWHLAIGLMKYPDAQCKLVVPSKLGFDYASTTSKLTPFGYDMKMKIKR